MIKVVCFDCWDTLFFNRSKISPVKQFIQKVQGKHDFYSALKVVEKNLMVKENANLEIATINILKEMKIIPNKKLLAELKFLLEEACLLGLPFPETMSVLDELKKKYKLCMITNTFKQSHQSMAQNYHFDNIFDLIIVSYKVGAVKPNPLMYEVALKKLKVKPDEMVMVGDTLEDDALAPEKLGIHGIVIDRKKKYVTYEKRITSLKQLENFLEAL
jgi:HAD superfamily hydrolase (TIGR01509 family)